MRWTGVMTMASGCGLFEGVENPGYSDPCRALSIVDDADLDLGTAFLGPAAERLDGLLGVYAIEAAQDAGGAYPGTLTVTRGAGPIVAVESAANPDEPLPDVASFDPALCGSSYQVPVVVVVDLDGGILRVEVENVLYLRESTPRVPVETTGGEWADANDAFSGTLAAPDGSPPEQVAVDLEFADGATPSGAVSVGVDSHYWRWLSF